MQRKKVFISSVQSEFAEERQLLFDYLTSDALLGKFFEPFIFENVPALNVHPTFEVSNPGNFPLELTIEELYTAHRSMPANPLLAEAMYLNGTIERMGTGTEEMTKLCLAKGLGKPEFISNYGFQTIIRRQFRQTTVPVNAPVNAPVEKLVAIISNGSFTRAEIMEKLQLSHKQSFLNNYIQPALKLGAIEMTIPDKPNSRTQKYRLTKATVNAPVNAPVNVPVGAPVEKLITTIGNNSYTRAEIMEKLQLSHKQSFLNNYIQPALKLGAIEMTIPDKPNSRMQKYRLTEKGKEIKNNKNE